MGAELVRNLCKLGVRLDDLGYLTVAHNAGCPFVQKSGACECQRWTVTLTARPAWEGR